MWNVNVMKLLASLNMISYFRGSFPHHSPILRFELCWYSYYEHRSYNWDGLDCCISQFTVEIVCNLYVPAVLSVIKDVSRFQRYKYSVANLSLNLKQTPKTNRHEHCTGLAVILTCHEAYISTKLLIGLSPGVAVAPKSHGVLAESFVVLKRAALENRDCVKSVSDAFSTKTQSRCQRKIYLSKMITEQVVHMMAWHYRK